MANTTVYPYGTGGSLPSSIGLINDTTTGGVDKALAAEQGKVLGETLRNARVKKIDFNKLSRNKGSFYSTKVWGFTQKKEQHVAIPCSSGDKFLISTTDENVPSGTAADGNWYSWLTSSYNPDNSRSGSTPYVTGYDRIWLTIAEGQTLVTAPTGAAYLILVVVNGSSSATDRTSWDIYQVEDLSQAMSDSATAEELNTGIERMDAMPFIKVGDYSVDGDDTTFVNVDIGHLEEGATFMLVLNELGWVDNTFIPDDNRYQFEIYGVNSSGTLINSTDIHYQKKDSIPSSKTFVAGENASYRFGGRCSASLSISATLYKQVRVIEDDSAEVNSDVNTLIAQAKGSSNGILGLLHFSDIHGDDYSAKRILKAMDDLGTNLNDAFVTGDVVHYYADATQNYPNDHLWWQGCGLPEKVLFVLGNHDGATTTATDYDVMRAEAAWDGKGKEWDYQQYFANYIDDVDYVMPTGYDDSTSPNYHACFWHKDYASAKVRVIGIDCMHHFDGTINPETGAILTDGYHWHTNEQEIWLIDRLNDTITTGNTANGYSVILVGHYCLDPYSGDNNSTNTSETGGRVVDYKTGAHSNFHLRSKSSFSLDNYGFNYRSKTQSYGNKTENNFADIIMSWKQRGGKFIAFLCGHMHYDLMFYPTNYPDLLCVSVNQAGWLRPQSYEDRSKSEYRLCSNYYAIDATNGLFKIIRIGINTDKELRPIHYLCYDYINKTILNEG